MVPGRERRRTKLERGAMRLVATGGIIGIAVVLGAVLVGQDVAGWIVGLVVGLTSVILARCSGRRGSFNRTRPLEPCDPIPLRQLEGVGGGNEIAQRRRPPGELVAKSGSPELKGESPVARHVAPVPAQQAGRPRRSCHACAVETVASRRWRAQ